MALPQKTLSPAAPTEPSRANDAPAAARPTLVQGKGTPAAAQVGPQKKFLKKGEFLFVEGENSRAMYLIKNGMLRIFKRKGTGSIELDTIRSGQIVGELAFLDGNPRSASGEALMDTEVVEISGPTFQAVLSQMPDWLKILLKTVVGRLRTASTRIRQLEMASTSVDYSEGGKRSTEYVYLGALDVMKTLSGLLLIASRHGKTAADGKAIEMRMGLTTRYINQIMGVPEAKIASITDALIQSGVMGILEDPANPANSRTVVHDIQFLDHLINYLNDENLSDPSKRHDITPRGFYIMALVAKHIKSFTKDESTGFVTVNLNAIRKAEAGAQGKEPFRIDEFEALVKLGYATNVDAKSSDEANTVVNEEEFLRAFRFQRVSMTIQAINEQKMK